MHDIPLYNSKIMKTYIEYLEKHYPDVDTDAILQETGITRLELEDDGCWYNHKQADDFQAAIKRRVADPELPRYAGRYITTSHASNLFRKLLTGFLNPSVAYRMVEKAAPTMTRNATMRARKLASNSVEITCTLNPGLIERPYQCQNRTGMFEAVAKIFTGEYASVEHSECLHKGGRLCRYIVSWNERGYMVWRKRTLYFCSASLLVLLPAFFLMSMHTWVFLLSAFATAALGLLFYSERMEKNVLAARLREQGDAASNLMGESDLRYNGALLTHEISQACSNILDVDELLSFVMTTLEKRFDFARGMILLADEKRKWLKYRCGYGLDPELDEFMRKSEIPVDKPHAMRVFSRVFNEKKPIIVDDLERIKGELDYETARLAEQFDSNSFICIPIMYENRAEGILAVDRKNQESAVNQSDFLLLTGIAPQIGISINNARSYRMIEESEERYRTLVRNMPLGLLRTTPGPRGRVLMANPAFLKMTGHGSFEEIVEMDCCDFYDKSEERSRFSKMLLDDGSIKDFVFRLKVKDGNPRWASVTAKVVYDEGTREVSYFDCIIVDITERIQMEDEKKKLETQFLQAQKMESIGTLAGGIAHDFNNLLTGIQGNISLALMGMNRKNPLYTRFENIEKYVQSGAELTKQLLGFARKSRYEVLPTDLNRLVNRSASLFGHTRQEIRIKELYENDLWTVDVDRGQIEQVLMNLYVNAWHAMLGGGDLFLKTENMFLDDEHTKPHGLRAGRFVRLSVTDTGIGMDENTRRRMFEPFFTTKERGKGTGLGLASVYGIVKNHGAIITVDSQIGKGSTFSIYFPASKYEGRPVVKDDRQKTEQPDKAILLVDDEEIVLRVSGELLRTLGYEVLLARTGQEALEIYKDRREHIGMVILDMIMPVMNGERTFRELKKINPHVKVFLTSGYGIETSASRIVKDGCLGFIRKPFKVDDLSKKIKNTISL